MKKSEYSDFFIDFYYICTIIKFESNETQDFTTAN